VTVGYISQKSVERLLLNGYRPPSLSLKNNMKGAFNVPASDNCCSEKELSSKRLMTNLRILHK